ncbi:MAG TPA: lanthionine synthetase LanC family protein, partial [Thermoanaerobaculia bacterium]|nr:lanthionine synthetase LanC family protein [Thermoanaerobaculia bacterium]
PLLERLLATGFLVPEGSAGAEGILPLLRPGEMLGGFEVRECVQELEDTDLYQSRGPEGVVALKVARPAEDTSGISFEWEAAVLRHLGGAPAPRLLAAEEAEGRRYLALEWCSGVEAGSAAWEWRRRGAGGRRALLALCREICAAYARLHERGVIHGDVHPRNVLVAGDGSVRLVDFGYARWEKAPADLSRPGRAGIAFFFEPEYAAAILAGQRPPEASVSGEQYAVAALLYFLVTGAHYRDFLLERDAMLRQIAGEPPLPFAGRGVEPWPEVEEVLARALAKDPDRRFPSIAALGEAFAAVREPGPSADAPARTPAADELLARVLARVEPGGDLYEGGIPEPPRASLNYGSAGVACALYRIAQTRESPSLLSLAELWAARAVAAGDADENFYDPEKGLEPGDIGRVSPYHTATGLFCAQALIAHAQGLPGVQRQAVSAFLQAARQPCENPDLTLGRSGPLLAAALLLDLGSGLDGEPILESLRGLGDDLLAGLWSEIDPLPPVTEDREHPVLGIAHGWAGYLYASLQWCRAAGRPLPPRLRERLDELGACARPWGRGLRWRWHGGESRWGLGSMPGWCNGSAGYVFLWTLAHRTLGDPAYAALAEGAAWNAWEEPSRNASLCCGLAGRAYALLNLYRHGGGPAWLARARDFAERAAQEASRPSDPPHSLYKGELGVAVLAADLARPEAAAMPFFEEEGWS